MPGPVVAAPRFMAWIVLRQALPCCCIVSQKVDLPLPAGPMTICANFMPAALRARAPLHVRRTSQRRKKALPRTCLCGEAQQALLAASTTTDG